MASQNRPHGSFLRLDGWKNLLTGLGVRGKDRSVDTTIAQGVVLPENELTAIYTSDGLGARIVNTKAGDMTRNGWDVVGDTEGALYRAGEELRFSAAVLDTLKWTRLYGGALIVMDFNGTTAPETALRITPSTRMTGVRVYPAPRVDLTLSQFSSDPNAPWFEDVDSYTIQKLWSGGSFTVHRSRCLVFKGAAYPPVHGLAVDMKTRYWGVSVLQTVLDALRGYGSALQGIDNIIADFIVGVYKLGNLEHILATNDLSALEKRMEAIHAQKSVIRAVLMGNEEDFRRDTSSVAGLAELIDRLMERLSSVSGYPLTKLFGRSLGGLSSKGDNELRDYYDDVKAAQVNELRDPLRQFYRLLNQTSGGKGGTVIDPEVLDITFAPVWTPSEEEMVGMRKTQMDTDKGYIELGVLEPQEVRANRFIGGYSHETHVEGE